MRWFRSNIRLGARLALFALAVQAVLSFGHVHFYALTRAPASAPTAVIAQDPSVAVLSSPAGAPKSDGSVGADCAICALIQLSAASMPAVAPAFLLPSYFEPRRLYAPLALVLAASPHFLFQARAPPAI
jgi:hypothetical protein